MRGDQHPRGLGGYSTPPGVPPLGDCALARQIKGMADDACDAPPARPATDAEMYKIFRGDDTPRVNRRRKFAPDDDDGGTYL